MAPTIENPIPMHGMPRRSTWIPISCEVVVGLDASRRGWAPRDLPPRGAVERIVGVMGFMGKKNLTSCIHETPYETKVVSFNSYSFTTNMYLSYVSYKIMFFLFACTFVVPPSAPVQRSAKFLLPLQSPSCDWKHWRPAERCENPPKQLGSQWLGKIMSKSKYKGVHIYMYLYTYNVYIYMYLYTYKVYIYVFVYIQCVYICICIHTMCIYMYLYTYTVYVYIYLYTYNVYICIFVYIYIQCVYIYM